MDQFLSGLWTKTKAWASSLWTKINTDVKELWDNNRIFLIIFGALILLVKFRQVIINLLVSNAQSIYSDAQKKDQVLQQQENQANQQANSLQQEAQKLEEVDSVDENWYKKN